MIVQDTKGREVRVRYAAPGKVAIEIVGRDGTRVQRLEFEPLHAAYLADDLHRMARELVVPVSRGTGGNP